jgi:hypothetical protein
LKEIGGRAFNGSVIKTIRIPSNVEYIGNYCFYGRRSLCEVVFESDSKLKEIGDYAFEGSGIKTIRIPRDIEKIGKKCFYGCESLSEVTFEGCPSIGFEAFSDCPLKYVKVAKGVILEYEFPEDCIIQEIDLTKND